MNSSRKFLSVFLASAIMLSITACAPQNNSENSSEKSSDIPSSDITSSSDISSDVPGDSSSVVSNNESSTSEPQPVDIGNGMALTGTPLDNSLLEEFSLDMNNSYWFWSDVDKEFVEGLETSGLGDVCYRALRLTDYVLSPIDINVAPAVWDNERKAAYIEAVTDDGVPLRYQETGYTYESFYNEYLKAFTEETITEIFKEYNFFLDYNGTLFVNPAARGGWIGEVHREYELISKTDTVIEFRKIAFFDDPSAEYNPELRDEYDVGITDFKFVLTDNGWRAANLPMQYKQED